MLSTQEHSELKCELEKGPLQITGIAGIAKPGCVGEVAQILDCMRQGHTRMNVAEVDDVCIGALYSAGKTKAHKEESQNLLSIEKQPTMEIAETNTGQYLLAPLYYGTRSDGAMCFASEASALHAVLEQIHEFHPGHGDFKALSTLPTLGQSQQDAALPRSRSRLENALTRCLPRKSLGGLLNVGGDASALGSLARPLFDVLHSMVGGLTRRKGL